MDRKSSYSGRRSSSSRTSGNFSGGGRNSYRGRRGNKKKSFAKQLDYRQFIKSATPVASQTEQEVEITFKDLNLHPEMQKALDARSYIKPTPIQAQAIPHIMAGRNLLGLADTGTGKTLAFLLPTLHKTLEDRKTKTLIIAPTRELVNQIQVELKAMARQELRIFSTVLIGGSSMRYQLKRLKFENQYIVATPGRLKDMIDKGHLKPSEFTHVILDEVDRMLDMGFIDDMRQVLAQTPSDAQRLFFSATLEKKIHDFLGEFLDDPVKVEVSSNNSSDNVHQDVVFVQSREEKIEKLREMTKKDEFTKVLVFCSTKRETDKVAEQLLVAGILSDSIHGDRDQRTRERILDKFRKGYMKVLVGTDVAARGIDVKDITHVINYDVPNTYEDYIHRIGRTGRGGKIGSAYTFVEKR